MDAVDGILPKEGEDTDTEEERRLFYVAMTRARQELHIFTTEKSSFAKTLFPKQQVRVIPKAVSARRRETPKNVIPPEAFYPGRTVVHQVFGTGTVAAREGDVLTINLEDGTKKRLLISVALRSGVLSIR
jgi:DNA helicase-2/ATP-dependent DNA helicase PcrA